MENQILIQIDNPQMQPKEIIKDCMYLCDNENNKNYYIVNSKILDTTENKKIFKQAIDTGNIYIDGWTATINTTLQEKKDNIKIIFQQYIFIKNIFICKTKSDKNFFVSDNFFPFLSYPKFTIGYL